MRPEFNLKTCCVISIAVHLMFFGLLNLSFNLSTHHFQQSAETYEFVPLSQLDSSLAEPVSKSRLKKIAVLKLDEVSNSTTKDQMAESARDVPAATSEDKVLPAVQADNLLSEGVRIVNIDEVTRSVKRTPDATAHNIEGKIKLKLLIDEKGELRQVIALNSLGYGLDEVARQAAQKLIFLPARIKSTPVAVEIYYTIKFTVNHQ